MTASEKRLTEHPAAPQQDPAGERLVRNLGAYEMMRERLEESAWGKWAVLCDAKLAGTYETVGDATEGMVKPLRWWGTPDQGGWRTGKETDSQCIPSR